MDFILLSISAGIFAILILLIKRKRINFNKKKSISMISMKEWMLFSSIDRNRIDELSRLETMKRKKILLKEIRSEYLKFKSFNNKGK